MAQLMELRLEVEGRRDPINPSPECFDRTQVIGGLVIAAIFSDGLESVLVDESSFRVSNQPAETTYWE